VKAGKDSLLGINLRLVGIILPPLNADLAKAYQTNPAGRNSAPGIDLFLAGIIPPPLIADLLSSIKRIPQLRKLAGFLLSASIFAWQVYSFDRLKLTIQRPCQSDSLR
jgi:hypothetical protein